MTFNAGAKLGPYEILAAIGTGGQGRSSLSCNRVSHSHVSPILFKQKPSTSIWP